MANFRIMPYSKTREAEADLVEIYKFGFLTFGLRQADRYHDGLEYVFELIADNPRLGRKIGGSDTHRQFHHGRHIIVYSAEDESVLIERVFHDAMDIDRYL
ncbi:MAG: type II toxin-antitoxin system RelE/ParE family toxin [Pseudomonadota bacterium]